MNRKELAKKRRKRLKEYLTSNYNSIIIMSFIISGCLLPLFVWYLLSYLTDATIMVPYSTANDIDKSVILSKLFDNQILFGIILIPILIIVFVLIMGVKNVTNHQLFREKVNAKIFFSGIKDNYLQGVLVGIFLGILYNVINLIKWYQSDIETPKIIYYVLLFFSVLFIHPIISIFINASVIYNGKILKAIRNSFIIFFGSFLKTTLFYLVIALPIVVIVVFDTSIWVYTVFIVLVVFGFGFMNVLECAYSEQLFDIFVNEKNYPEKYALGLND